MPKPIRAARPRDAASLILVKDMDAEPKVLLGRRADSHHFMPGMYVFPGGALQRDDFAAAADGALAAAHIRAMGVRGDQRRAEALAKAAIRETAEETGLMLAASGEVGARAIQASGLQPCLRALTYLGRAITPTSMPTRFDARFFIAPADALRGRQADSDELADLRWIAPRQCGALRMVDITACILQRFDEILRRARDGQSFVYRYRGERAEMAWRNDDGRIGL